MNRRDEFCTVCISVMYFLRHNRFLRVFFVINIQLKTEKNMDLIIEFNI